MSVEPSSVAYHEAAHVVLSIYYDFTIGGVSIEPNNNSKGRAMTDEELESTDWEKCKEYCHMTLAGPIAEKKFGDVSVPGDRNDKVTVNRIINLKHQAASLMDKLGDPEAGERVTLDQDDLDEFDKIKDVRRELRKEADSLLERKEIEEAIQYVAEKVEKKINIEGEAFNDLRGEVEEILASNT